MTFLISTISTISIALVLQLLLVYFVIGIIVLAITSFVYGIFGIEFDEKDFIIILSWPFFISNVLGILINVFVNSKKEK